MSADIPASSISVRTATRKPSGAKRAGVTIWSTVFVGGRLHAHPHAGQAKNTGLLEAPVTNTAAPNLGQTGQSPAMKTCVLTLVPVWLTSWCSAASCRPSEARKADRPPQHHVSQLIHGWRALSKNCRWCSLQRHQTPGLLLRARRTTNADKLIETSASVAKAGTTRPRSSRFKKAIPEITANAVAGPGADRWRKSERRPPASPITPKRTRPAPPSIGSTSLHPYRALCLANSY
jgi:hypothetical protein